MASQLSPPKIPQLELPSKPPSPTTKRPHLDARTQRTTTSRLPPPTLFQGPPSKNASHIDLALSNESPNIAIDTAGRAIPRASRIPPPASFSGGAGSAPPFRPSQVKVDEFKAESLWAEMQKTLADVELSATNPSHVFGKEHAQALEQLRERQLGLAMAWAKSEREDITDYGDADDVVEGFSATTDKDGEGIGGKDRDREKGSLEEETQRDIQLARRRREANDRYFERVNEGVLEVVRKLDEVAGAMRKVERESRDIWKEDIEGNAVERAGLQASVSEEDVSPGRGMESDMESEMDNLTDKSESLMADSPVEHRK